MNAITPKRIVQAEFPAAKCARIERTDGAVYVVTAGGSRVGKAASARGAWAAAAEWVRANFFGWGAPGAGAAPISGGSPEADGGQHSAPATDGAAPDPVEVVAAGAELYRHTFATTKSTVRKFMRADASMAVRRMFRAVPHEDRLALRPHLVALCPEAFECDPDTMIETWFLDVCQRLGSDLAIETATCPVSFPPAGGDFDESDKPETTEKADMANDTDRTFECNRCGRQWQDWAMPEACPDCGDDDFTETTPETTDDAEMGFGDHMRRVNDSQTRAVELAMSRMKAEAMMGEMGIGPVSGGAPDERAGGWFGHVTGMAMHHYAAGAERSACGRATRDDATAGPWPPERIMRCSTCYERTKPPATINPGPELLPCPFCGSSGVRWTVDDTEMSYPRIQCSRCGVMADGTSREDTLATWNARAPHPDHANLAEHVKAILPDYEEMAECRRVDTRFTEGEWRQQNDLRYHLDGIKAALAKLSPPSAP